jgi:hypothetical protein
METSFFTGFGHLCRFVLLGAIGIFFINATFTKPITISVQHLPEVKWSSSGESTKTKNCAEMEVAQ